MHDYKLIRVFCLVVYSQQHFLYDQIISFLSLLLTFVDDMFDGNWHGRVSRMSQFSPLTCGTGTGL